MEAFKLYDVKRGLFLYKHRLLIVLGEMGNLDNAKIVGNVSHTTSFLSVSCINVTNT